MEFFAAVAVSKPPVYSKFRVKPQTKFSNFWEYY